MGLRTARRREAARRSDGCRHDVRRVQPPPRPGGRGRRHGVRRRHVQQPRPADLPERSGQHARRRHQPAERRGGRAGREHLRHRLGVEPDPQDHAGRRRDEDRRLPTTQLGRRGRGRHGLRHGGSSRRREANHRRAPRRLQACLGRRGLDRGSGLQAAAGHCHRAERRDNSGRCGPAGWPQSLPPARGLPLLRPVADPCGPATSRRRERPTGACPRLRAPDRAGVPALRRDRSAVSAVRALPRPGERRAVGLLSPTGSTAPNLTGLGRDARDPPADEHSVLDRRRAGRRLERRARPDREPDRHANRPVGHGA